MQTWVIHGESTYNWRVVRNLFHDQTGLSPALLVGPNSVEQLSEDGIEGLRVSRNCMSMCLRYNAPSSRSPSFRYGSRH